MSKEEAIARVCHAVNRAYCKATGDDSQLSWEEAPLWQKASAIQSVRAVLARPSMTPEELHEAWAEAKREAGWRYGPIKNETEKEHPGIIPYADLPEKERIKDFLFAAVVEVLSK